MTNWKEIHPDFTEELQKEWEDNGFIYKECKEWVNAGLQIEEFDYTQWLRNMLKKNPEDINCINDKLILQKQYEEYLWKKKVKEGQFNSENSYQRINLCSKCNQSMGTSYGGECPNCHFFWIDAQEWLDREFLRERRGERKILKIDDFLGNKERLKGFLDLKDFTNLEKLSCGVNKLESIDISKCKKLSELDCEGSHELKNLDVGQNTNLVKLKCSNSSLDNLDVSLHSQLVNLFCSNNKIVDLKLGKNINLTEIECSGNNLVSVDLSGCPKLIKFNCRDNLLVSLDLSQCAKLTYLDCGDNPLTELSLSNNSELIILSCVNIGTLSNLDLRKNKKLVELSLTRNNFTKKMTTVNVNNIKENIIIGSLFGDLNLKRERKDAQDGRVGKATSVLSRSFRRNEERNKIDENYKVKNLLVYNEIRPINGFSWKIDRQSQPLLPLKLYNIKEDKVELTKMTFNIKNYAILSYVWGSLGTPSDIIGWKSQYKKDLNPAGYKTLFKATKACKLLGIDYLWMDQLCIKQGGEGSKEEKEREVPKMGQYYSNASITLVAIHINAEESKNKIGLDLANILKTILNSQWFQRSWTFQEGWLSKQTIFMFDDILIDGRILAGVWVLNQPSGADCNYNNIGEFSEGSKKIATPLGWTYYGGEYEFDDKINLNLSQALAEVRERGRGIPIDGLYSILGLLPYGKEVEPKYKENKNEWDGLSRNYTKEEFEERLIEVMKIAVKNGYGEPLAWHGENSIIPGLSWLPQIDENKGAVNVTEWLNIHCKFGDITIDSDNKIGVKGCKYIIKNADDLVGSISQANDKLFRRKTEVEANENYQVKVFLWGTEETLLAIENEDIILVPNKREWKSDKPFAVLLEKSKTGDYYWRKGLIEFGGEYYNEKENFELEETNEEEFIIWTSDFGEWEKINSAFWNYAIGGVNKELIAEWTNCGFSFGQVKVWVKKVGLLPNEANFAYWLQNAKNIDSLQALAQLKYGELLKHENLNKLREEYQKIFSEKQQANVQIPPK